MTTLHTKGPWVHGGPQSATIATKAEGGNLGERIAVVFDDEIMSGDAKANARLIAASPDYDEAAKMVRDSAAPMKADEYGTWESGVIISGEAYNAIMDAITKAAQA